LTITIPHRSAIAVGFDACANSLLNSGISQEQAGTACADALEPKELAACVDKIKGETALAAEDALKSCYRVRRPEDLASCVVAIDSTTEGSQNAALALDNCRRSLLPARYAECVVGLNDAIPDLGVAKTMETCISAEAFPEDLFGTSE
jgi:hypothetical protein